MPEHVFGAVNQFLEKKFGGPIRAEKDLLVVGITEVEAAVRDPERVSLTFVNLGLTTLFLSPLGQASVTEGIRLFPSGGLVSISIDEDAILQAVRWVTIGDAVGGSLFRISVRREGQTRPIEGTS